jgi:hypothetical protein
MIEESDGIADSLLLRGCLEHASLTQQTDGSHNTAGVRGGRDKADQGLSGKHEEGLRRWGSDVLRRYKAV